MSSFSGSNPTPSLSKPASETLQLYSVVLGDELEIEGEGGDSLKITSKIFKDGIAEKHTRHLHLKREAVLLYYTIATNMDLTKIWNVGIVYGSGLTRETVEYPLQSEQDAFRFQYLVTGYRPHTRFTTVAAFALEQHIALGKRATEIKLTGEAQLWWVPQPQPKPFSAKSRSQSIYSLTSTLTGATILPADKGKVVALTKAKAPPLLVLFAKLEGRNGEKSFHMMRVDITNLAYRDSSRSSKRLELISASKKKFKIYTLAAHQAESWNLCHLRPGLYSKYFKKHKCEELILDFGDEQDVAPFKRSLLQVRARALGISLTAPLASRGLSSRGTATPQAVSVVDDSFSASPNLDLDDDKSSEGYTVNEEEEAD